MRASKTDANQAEIVARMGVWSCKTCGKQARATAHQMRKTYCCRACMVEDYKTRFLGGENPNHRDAGRHICKACGGEFKAYAKARQYCSFACYNGKRAIRPVVVKGSAPSLAKVAHEKCKPAERVRLNWKCAGCGEERLVSASAAAKKFCSRDCQKLDTKKRREAGGGYGSLVLSCQVCHSEFRASPSNRRIFCSYGCFLKSGGAIRAGEAAARAIMKYGAKKDANHNELFEVIREVAPAHDTSHMGCGFPDGIAWICNGWHLFDIKNPKTGYGRRGLNPRQRKWAEQWKGGPVYLLYTREDAIAFREGRFDELKRHGYSEAAANDEK